MSASSSATRPTLIRNAGLNLLGHVIPLAVGVAALPMTVRGLGVDAFGVLAFAWALLGYFALFDLGLGRAATKFVAEALARNRPERSSPIVWTSVGLSLALGAAGGATLAVLTPLLAQWLRLPADLVDPTRRVFFTLAAALPFILTANTLRAVLEADQRFGIVNAVKIPANTALFAVPAVGVWLDWSLPLIVAVLALTRVATMAPYLWFCVRVLPHLRTRPRVEPDLTRRLIAYGSWVTVSNVLGPILTYLDRFMIGALLSTAAVTYYAAPYEMVTRLWILPASVVATLFPALSATAPAADDPHVASLTIPAVKYLLLLMGPIVIVLVLYAPTILTLWMGTDFAQQSATVFRVLAIGVLLNSIAQVPFSLLQAAGRADLPAKLYLGELAVYVPLTVFLILKAGINGAAWGWLIRVAADAVLQVEASRRVWPGAWRAGAPGERVGAVLIALGALTAALAVTTSLLQVRPLSWHAGATGTWLLVFSAVVWWFVLDAGERRRLMGATRSAAVRRG